MSTKGENEEARYMAKKNPHRSGEKRNSYIARKMGFNRAMAIITPTTAKTAKNTRILLIVLIRLNIDNWI